MAHLTCLTHGQRSFVAEHPKSDQRHKFYQVLHRGNRDKCTDETVRHGRFEFSLIVAALGLLSLKKAVQSGSNWTAFSEFDLLERTRPTRKARRAARR